MARARNIKPGFFANDELAELSAEVRLLFIGLWTLADREGRLEDRPKRIKGELFAFDTFDVDSMLNQLQSNGFVVRYEVSGRRFMQVVNFVKHQDPHYKEKASEIPPPPGSVNLIDATGITRETRARIMARDGYRCLLCGSEEYLSIDHKVPASRGGGGEDENLQVLCLTCNRRKGNKLPGEAKGARRSKHADTSLRTRRKLESTSDQHQAEHPGSVPLIPDSGFRIPDSGFLIPDSIEKTTAAAPLVDRSADAALDPQTQLPGTEPVPKPYTVPDCPYAALLAAYHAELPMLPGVTVLNEPRREHMRARWREVCSQERFDAEAGLEWFRWYFAHAAKSKHLTGRGRPNRDTGRAWHATFDWLLMPTNFAKVIDGNYLDERVAA